MLPLGEIIHKMVHRVTSKYHVGPAHGTSYDWSSDAEYFERSRQNVNGNRYLSLWHHFIGEWALLFAMREWVDLMPSLNHYGKVHM